eukprot:3082513-Pyramimonas_sp.AAC.1
MKHRWVAHVTKGGAPQDAPHIEDVKSGRALGTSQGAQPPPRRVALLLVLAHDEGRALAVAILQPLRGPDRALTALLALDYLDVLMLLRGFAVGPEEGGEIVAVVLACRPIS